VIEAAWLFQAIITGCLSLWSWWAHHQYDEQRVRLSIATLYKRARANKKITPTHTYTCTYPCKETLTSSQRDISVHNEIDKTKNQKPNRRVAGYNTATVTLCGGVSGATYTLPHLTSPNTLLTHTHVYTYSLQVVVKWCSFCCCQNGNEKTHKETETPQRA